MYPWWQCVLFFCAITCSIAQREGSLSNDSLNAQTIEDDSFLKIIFRSLKSPDVQTPVSKIPIRKSRVISDLMKRYPVSGQYGNLPRSQKWYSRRLFKRAAENPDAFMTAFKSAIKEALRELLVENGALSPQSDTSALWSRVNENTGSLSSDAEVKFLRSIGFRSNDIPSDSVQPSLKNDTSVPAQAAQIWSTMRSPFTSSEATSVDSSSERVPLKLQMQPSVTALPAGRTLSYYSNMTSTEKSKTYTEVTTAPGSSKAFNLRRLASSYSRSSDIQNPITKDPFTMAANVVFENSTLRNILTSNLKSAEKLGSVVLPITEKSSTSSGLVNLIVTIAEGQFSPDGKTLSQTKHSIPQNDHTISPILVSASPYTKHDLSRSTFKIPRPSVLPKTREAFATSVSFASKNTFANFDQITSTKEKLIPALRMRSTSMTAAMTSKMPIKSDLTVTQISSTYKSTSAGTSENTSNEGALANTAGTLISTFSSPKHFSSTERNPVSTEAVSFETDYEMLSSVTPLPIMARDHKACILKVRNTTITVQTPLAEQTSCENESTVSSARIRTSINPKSDAPYTGSLASTELASTVALSSFTDSYSTDQKENASVVPLNYLAGIHSPKPPKFDPTATVSSFTNTFPESTTFPNTTTLSLPDYEVFQDAINGNVNSNQTTPLVTNTMSSTVLPFWFSKSLTSVTPSWKSTSPFFQRERSTALQITPRSQANLGPTRVTSTLSRYSTSPSVLNTVFTISQLRNGTTVKHLGSTNTSGVFTSKMPESKTNSYNISSMPPKSSILYSSTYVTPQSQAISSTTRMRSAGSQSLLSTAMNPLFTASQSRNQTTTDISSLFTVSHLGNKTTKTHINSTSATYKTSQTSTAITWNRQSAVAPSKSATSDLPHSKSTTRVLLTERRLTVAKHQSYSVPATTLTSGFFSTRIHGNTSEAPAFKIWIPQSSDGIPTKSTTSFTASKGLREIQTTSNTTLSISVLVALPLTFHLAGISYSVQLGDHTTDEYKRLEREVILVLNKVFATKYQQEYVQAEILGFSNGSVVVQSKIAFNSGSSAPSASDIVRTVLTDNIAIKKNYFGWNINASTVQCNGYTIKNLQQESFSISFVVLHVGFIATSQNDQKKQSYLESLQKEVLLAVNTTFPVTKVSFSQIRNLYGDLEVRGILYLQSSMFTNVQDLLSTLLPLANVSVDLSSINVDGMHKELKVYPFNFLLTNMPFAIKLLDMASNESQRLSKDLSTMIEFALYDKSLLQVVVREFSSGSVVCKGDLIYQFPAPGSGEILRQFIRALTSDGMLGSSTYKVDFQSVTIGDSTSSPYDEYTNFPGYAVAIIVMCGLTILLFPLLVYVCYKTRMLGHRRKETIRQRHDPDQQSQRLEMDNRAFRASIELP